MSNDTSVDEMYPEMFRPDRHLPPELRHEKIREVRDVSARGKPHFQIVFDQDSVPHGYWNPKPEDWEMRYARTEYHNEFDGVLGWLFPDRTCICIMVEYTGDWDV